jgi:hypothetical protein
MSRHLAQRLLNDGQPGGWSDRAPGFPGFSAYVSRAYPWKHVGVSSVDRRSSDTSAARPPMIVLPARMSPSVTNVMRQTNGSCREARR